MRSLALIGVSVFALAGAGCADTLEPGELGDARIMGIAQGAAPLAMVAPRTDRDGNVYVMAGSRDGVVPTRIFVGRTEGGWATCDTSAVVKSQGAHSWVGRTQDKAWFWSGSTLFAVSRWGNCRALLDRDPATAVDLRFVAVVPWVRDTPSQTSVVALVSSLTDPVPFQIRVDLRATGVYTNVEPFEPPGASNVEVLGVGANPDEGEGYILVRYMVGDQPRVEARFVDADAETITFANVPYPPELGPYSVVSFLEPNVKGLVAGLLENGQVLVFDKSGGTLRDVPGMTPVGVHRWEDELFVVGLVGARPAIAKIANSGNIGTPMPWGTSEKVAGKIGGGLKLIDDRALPSRSARWDTSRSAIGDFPFLSAHSLDHYADGTTGWALAGPSFDAGGQPFTLVAFVPVGVAYP